MVQRMVVFLGLILGFNGFLGAEGQETQKGSNEQNIKYSQNEQTVRNVPNPTVESCDVVVLPVALGKGSEGVRAKVYEKVIDLFERGGFRVASKWAVEDFLRRNSANESHFGDKVFLQKLTQAFPGKFVINTRVTDYRAEKKFRVSGLLGGGWTLYGTCGLWVQAFDPREGKFLFSKNVKKSQKQQFLAVFQGNEPVCDEAIATAVRAAFDGFIRRAQGGY